jgi:hypothetical protein
VVRNKKGVLAMAGVTHRTSAALLAGAVSVLVVIVASPTARADHIRPAALCNEKFNGDFEYRLSLPINSRRTGLQLGRVAISVDQLAGQRRRVCAVTVRSFHERRRFTSIKIKRSGDSKWRKDASYVYRRYAGPVVRSNPNGSCVEFVGRIDGGVPVKSSYCY